MTIHPARTVRGQVKVPGDKGISHRAILFGAGVEGRSRIIGLSTALDVKTTLAVAHFLSFGGVGDNSYSQLESFPGWSEGLDSLELEGRASWQRWPAAKVAECENSGTTMRLLMGILAGRPATVEIRGDASLSRRPMDRVAEPLRRMGALIELSVSGTAPVRVHGGELTGIRYELPVASAQVKSAVLLAGLQASGETIVVEPSGTRDHTERLLGFLGAPVVRRGNEIVVQATELFGDKEINIPGDFSSASFLLTAAAIAEDGDVTIEDVGLNPTRTAFLQVLKRFGARVETGGLADVSGEPRGWVRVRSGDRTPPWVAPDEIPACIDELPLVAVLGAVAEGKTEVRGAAELRVKESDRIAAIVGGLRGIGVRAEAAPDGFVVEGGAVEGGAVDSHGDHRIAMALAVAGLAGRRPTTITGWEAVAVSYPEFGEHLHRLTT